jgi:hypothetical protein
VTEFLWGALRKRALICSKLRSDTPGALALRSDGLGACLSNQLDPRILKQMESSKHHSSKTLARAGQFGLFCFATSITQTGS